MCDECERSPRFRAGVRRLWREPDPPPPMPGDTTPTPPRRPPDGATLWLPLGELRRAGQPVER